MAAGIGLERAYNFDDLARRLLNGDLSFLIICHFNELYQPSNCLTDHCPIARRDGGDTAGLVEELSPSGLTGVENVGVVLEHPVGEIGLAQILPDVLRRVELWTCRRQRHHGEVFRDLELARGVPARLVEDDHGVCAGRDGMAYFFEVFAHRRSVGIRHDDRDTSVAAWANCTEQIGVLVTLIFWLPWSRALLGPLVDERVLLSDPHFILEPHLDRGCQCKSAHGLQHTGWKTFFLKVAIASRSCLGCSGRALMCEKPSFLRTRPRLTSDRSTPKRSPRTRLRSTQRQRATPSFSGSGPASTRRRNSSICSFESFGGRPGDLALIRPSAPSSLKRCTQSRSV